MSVTASEPRLVLSELFSSLDRGQIEANTADRATAIRSGRLVLFGCGSLGRKCLAALRAAGIEPVAFADNNPKTWNVVIEGLQILEPKTAADLHGETAIFVVSIFNPQHCFGTTRAQLAGLGCDNVISFPQFARCFATELLPYYAVDEAQNVLDQQTGIQQAFDLLADDASRREFIAQVAWRLTDRVDLLGPPDSHEQYFAEDLFSPIPSEQFIDCGAYTGDTLTIFLDRYQGGFEKFLAFEPDPENFAKLSATVAALPIAMQSRTQLYPYATGAARGSVSFAAGGTSSSALSSAGGLNVDVVTLDDQLALVEPTFIKMDIEGAEEAALQGATDLIRRFQPVLAICVYHQQNHMWRLPLFINATCPDYSFYLRRYAADCWELVLYAVPKGRIASPGNSR